jgi:DnaJ-domain-containing protein 1
MLTINITREGSSENDYTIRLRSDDRDEFHAAIESLKNYIDAACRSYDPQKKKWHVDEAASDCMHDWLGHCTITLGAQIEWFGARRTEQKRTQPPPREPRTSKPQKLLEACKTLCITPDAPAPVVKAAYRALAQLHHPDAGGKTETMQKINAAYELLARAAA